MELKLRKFNKFVDKTFIEGGKEAKDPVLLVSVAAVFENPWRDKGFVEDLKPIILDYHNKFGVTEFTKMKSSLKFCVIAASEFDLYIAEARASEWDIAAGHAILRNAGGIITDFDNKEIYYGKKGFKNPSLILRRGSQL